MEQTSFTQSDVYGSQPEPVKVVEHIVKVRQPVVIERTSKKYKRMILIANLLFFGGIAFFFFTFSNTAHKLFNIGTGVSIAVVAVIASFILYFAGRFLAWWNNG